MNPRIFHIRNPDRRGAAVTLAFEQMDAIHYRCGVAICSLKDQFSRKRGRAIAIGRLEKSKYRSHPPIWGTPDEIIRGVTNEVSQIFPKDVARELHLLLSRVPKSKLFS